MPATKHFRLLAGVALALGLTTAPAFAEDATDGLTAPIEVFVDGINTAMVYGDLGPATAAFAQTNVTIVDEAAPFVWQGPDAFQAWGKAMLEGIKQNNLSDTSMAIGEPSVKSVAGDRGYVVVPATYRFRTTGGAMRENGLLTFVLQKGATGWLISGWTWAGTKPETDPDVAAAEAAAAQAAPAAQ